MEDLAFAFGWHTTSVDYAASARSLCIEMSYEIQRKEELERELCRLFQSAYRNEVPLRPTWVCQYEDRPDLGVIVSELAENREGIEAETAD